jgi:hypothetical protein
LEALASIVESKPGAVVGARGDHSMSEPTTEATDRLLVVRMAGGDGSALAELHDRHGGLVYSLARAIGRLVGSDR